MKKKIHPKYNKEVEIKCACGNVFKVGSTAEKLDLEICDDCHPFYTGKEKLVDSTGRVDRFKQRVQKMEAMQAKGKEKTTPKKEAEETPEITKETEKKETKK